MLRNRRNRRPKMIVWSGASFILRWSCLSRVNLSGVEPNRVKLTISSHVKCDPIPRVEYIWIRNTLTDLVEINNNKRVLGPLKGDYFETYFSVSRSIISVFRRVFLHQQCLWRHKCKTPISSQNRWSTNSSKWCACACIRWILHSMQSWYLGVVQKAGGTILVA